MQVFCINRSLMFITISDFSSFINKNVNQGTRKKKRICILKCTDIDIDENKFEIIILTYVPEVVYHRFAHIVDPHSLRLLSDSLRTQTCVLSAPYFLLALLSTCFYTHT